MTDRAAPPRLVRPRLLAAAARAGAAAYQRERDLSGVLPGGATPRNLLAKLTEAEAQADAERRAQSPSYSVARHVKLLAALLAEMTRIGGGPTPSAA